jgi:hypothetical protein
MAYDPGTGQLVLFGGNANGSALADTWIWTGATWTQQSPTTSPTARWGASLAYDSGTGQLVLFGGDANGSALADTWIWTGSTWTQQSPTTSPPARSYASLAYDPGTGQMVLFGGDGNSGPLADTWIWTGSTWTQQSPTTNPPARSDASMAYDPGSGQLVLFGGYKSSDLADTWTWTGSTWTQLSPTTSPPARSDASMAYDPGTGQLILFGGYDDNINAFLNDTWTWNGSDWSQLSPATVPSARDDAALAYDPGSGQMVLFGGDTNDGLLADSWTWGIPPSSSYDWSQQSPTTSPTGRWGASMAYDPGSGQLVLFGGESCCGNLADTWTWNGSTWSELSPSVSPPARSNAFMAYDPGTGQLVLFGGVGVDGFDQLNYLDDTWIWNGSTWSELSPATSPSARSGASMAYDPGTGQLVLFGGYNSSGMNDTWTWNGTTWSELSPATSPTARFGASMAYDPGTGQLVLFGGRNTSEALGDTWAWNGITWANVSAPADPPGRSNASMAYDPGTGQLVLFSGYDGNINADLNDTWTWNGSTWTQLSPSTSPPARDDASMAYDPGTGQLVLFGGYANGGGLSDTWIYEVLPSNTITVTSTAPADAAVGGLTYTPTATATSGDSVVITSATTSECTINSGAVTFVGSGTCTLDFNDAGNAYYPAANQVTQSFNVTPAPGPSGNTLPSGAELGTNQFVASTNGQYQLVMQPDGNLVEFGPGNTVVFATGTNATTPVGSYANMQSDGNFVVYSASNVAVYSSNTPGESGTSLTLLNNGQLVLEAPSGAVLWGPGIFAPGQLSGATNQSFTSPNGQYRLVMQSDGNLVEYGPSSSVVFASGTNATSPVGSYANMQSDGNFVVYSASSVPVFASNTSGNPGAYLDLSDTGQLTVYSASGTHLWGPGIFAPGQLSGATNQSFTSPNGQYRLVMQSDGNLVEYGPSSSVVFASGTNATSPVGSYANMQSDGNFVVYSASNVAVFASNTWGNPEAYLTLTDGGTLEVTSAAGTVLWTAP